MYTIRPPEGPQLAFLVRESLSPLARRILLNLILLSDNDIFRRRQTISFNLKPPNIDATCGHSKNRRTLDLYVYICRRSYLFDANFNIDTVKQIYYLRQTIERLSYKCIEVKNCCLDREIKRRFC